MAGNNRRPRLAAGATGRDLGDEYLFYDRDRDRVHVLNGTARAILLLCDGSRTEGEVAAAVAASYGVEPGPVLEDTRKVVDELAGLGLVEWD